MINIYDLVTNGLGDVHITVTANDLIEFAHQIVAEIQKSSEPTKVEDEMMTSQEVLDYLKIRPTTLWMWGKKNILKPHKVGRKCYYSKADILALQRGEISV